MAADETVAIAAGAGGGGALLILIVVIVLILLYCKPRWKKRGMVRTLDFLLPIQIYPLSQSLLSNRATVLFSDVLLLFACLFDKGFVLSFYASKLFSLLVRS